MSNIVVLHEDRDLLVLNKPSGITVNKAETTKGEFTVQDWLEQKFPIFPSTPSSGSRGNSQSANNQESDFYKRAGIVHRIDKETSGILLVAKNPESFQKLQAQFKERKVEKTYLALVHGQVEPAVGEISVPVARLPWNRQRFGVLAGGKEAVTKYKVLNIKYLVSGEQKEPLTLLELNPKTGRTHQIRVHLKYFNHPIFGDSLYAGRKTSRNDRKFLGRVFLHAKKISFHHPKSLKKMEFDCPLPIELENFLEYLKS